MRNLRRPSTLPRSRALLGIVTLLSCAPLAPAASQNPVVPKWTRFEQAFKSSLHYSAPLQACTLRVTFTSPLGETNLVCGFWDGGKTWRVRFSPDQPGRWTYQTRCSDPANRGLNLQSGAFLCTAPVGSNRFNLHGPIRLARDRRHFEHQDGTPFLWIADSVWNGPRRSSLPDWTVYAQIRANQKFTAAQWAVASGRDIASTAPLPGRMQPAPDVAFFQRLDARVDALDRAGILNVIAPQWAPEPETADAGTDEQRTAMLQYLVARWGGNNVAWLLADHDPVPSRPAGWKKAGQAVFAEGNRGPVVLFGPSDAGLAEAFGAEPWVTALGSFPEHAGKPPLSVPAPPRIGIVCPFENSLAEPHRRVNADDVGRELWNRLLMASAAGVSYGTGAVADWDAATDPNSGDNLPLWHKSLFLPGAKQIAVTAELLGMRGFWELRPAPESLAGPANPPPAVAAARTWNKELSLFHVPEGRTLELAPQALPASPVLTWIHARSGETRRAVAVVGPRSIKLSAPGPGDWLLLIRVGKAAAAAPSGAGPG